MKPHKHAELIKAWADGAEIQECVGPDQWWDDENPSWHPDVAYRIKPKSLKSDDVVFTTNISWDKGWQWINTTSTLSPNLKITFGFETGELKSAEVIK